MTEEERNLMNYGQQSEINAAVFHRLMAQEKRIKNLVSHVYGVTILLTINAAIFILMLAILIHKGIL